MDIVTLSASQCILGESPIWHSARRSFFWVNVCPGILYELDLFSQCLNKWDIGKCVSLVLEGGINDVVLAVEGGVVTLNLESGEQKWIVRLEDSNHNIRCNDGALDLEGRLWVGTMDKNCKAGVGSLYRIDGTNVKKMIGNLTIPNGLVWSLDHERMYFIDTPKSAVVCYLFNKKTGDIYYEKEVIVIPPIMGMPDGMTIDAEGMLWIALYGGGGVARWNPVNGILLEVIKLPALNITNCEFVGDDLSDMMITSARENMTSAQLEEYPESGNVFIIYDLFVKGVKTGKPTLWAVK